MTWNPHHMLESDVTNVHAVELTNGIWFHDADGRPSGRRPIGYPILLGLLYKIFGVNLNVVWITNLVLFVLSAYFIYGIARMIFSERIGLWSVFLFSIYPISIYSIKLVTDEHLFLPLWYAGLYLLIRETKGRRLPLSWLWYGLLFGYATMTRTHSIFMPFVVGFAYFLLRLPWRKVVVSVILVLGVMQLINLPWVIRNYKAWGVLVPYTATNFFVYAQVNSTAGMEGGGHIPQKGEPGYSEELERAAASGNEGLYHSLCGREMSRWIAGHPLQFLNMGIGRLLIFMGWNRSGGVWPIWFQYYEGSYDPKRPISPAVKEFLEEAAHLFYYFLFFCFCFSIVRLALRWNGFSENSRYSLLVLGSVFVFWFLEQMVIYPDRKYRFPLEPLMVIFASFFLDWLAVEFKWRLPVGRKTA